jgi:EAL domain-containing protein (putative c-di-GMP-specific phosphodiesterase class I)/FixJ family two-component response regulator
MSLATIYLLDDDSDMLTLLSDMVDDAGLSADCFNHGHDFFQQVKNFSKNSLLVLDLQMPEMDGIEVMRRLSTMSNPPALVLISGHDSGVLHSAEKLGKAHNLNIISSITKPIQLSCFQELLLDYLESLGKSAMPYVQKNTNELAPEELLNAITNDQLILFYQPQININTRKLISCEALVRWQHPEKGMIFPDQFINVAEQNGWMGKLTSWVLKQAIEQGRKWQDAGINIPISVNVSANDITSLLLPEMVSELLMTKQLYPSMLNIEVTESALMGELVTSLDILTRLRLKGLGLSIDDFGTGYSSLSQLHKIPFSELKIDQSFIFSMLEDDDARAIVKTCIILGHELNMQVVAEGVETLAHFEVLNELGCDIAQGYYFSRPVSACDFEQWSKDYAQKNINFEES